MSEEVKVTHCGWFAFEGFGRPFEAWAMQNGGWRSFGRAFTYRGARRRAKAARLEITLQSLEDSKQALYASLNEQSR